MRAPILFISILILFFTSCSKSGPLGLSLNCPNCNPGIMNTFNIGDTTEGGIIFYLDSTRRQGLVAALNDEATDMPWDAGSNGFYKLGANDSTIWSGAKNTDTIIHHLSGGAAISCTTSMQGAYGDWYLPSKNELNLLYLRRNMIGGFNAGGSINNFLYWSSTESSDSSKAWAQSFVNGNKIQVNKWDRNNVRPIRTFNF